MNTKIFVNLPVRDRLFTLPARNSRSPICSIQRATFLPRVAGIIIVDLPTWFNHEQEKNSASSGYRCEQPLDYPTRPVRWIVGFPPGGPNDITARLMADQLSARLHQPFVVENRPGASSNVATAMVAKSPPDGYTIMELATVN
jgi:hypothetical protein